MDPNAALEQITLADTDAERAEACQALSDWIEQGGFEPTWSDQPKAACIFHNLPYHNQPDYA